VADRIVGWDGGAVHVLNPDTRVWTQKSSAPQSAQPLGTFGRFRYSPIENAYVLLNDVDKNVLIYKLTEGPGIIPLEMNRYYKGFTANIKLKISPNPFNATTNITVNYPLKGKDITLKVFNIHGKLVQELTREHGVFVFNAIAHPPGVYLAELKVNQTSYTQKMTYLK
jgi:hypothetical protein